MLATALWFVALLGLVAAIALDGAAEFARAGVRAAADHAVEGAMQDAVAQYQGVLAAAIAGLPNAALLNGSAGIFGGAPPALGLANLSAPSPSSTLAPPGPGQLVVSYAVAPTTVAAPVCSGPHTGGDTIAWLQCHGFVQESRMSLQVTVNVYAPGGDLLAKRMSYVSLRLFAQPPYSAVVGSEDGSADAASGSASPVHEGDVGGDTVAGATPPQPSPWPSGGTLLHVSYRCTDGSGPSGQPYACAGAAPPDPDGALAPGVTWSDGNQPAAP